MSEHRIPTEPIRVMSFNLRFDNPADGPNRWKHRRRFVAELVGAHGDLVGMQEARRCPLGWLVRHLPEFGWLGVGRANGRRRGEYSPIFYRADRFDRVDRGTFWLSEHPDEPGSESWATSSPRIATWAVLRDRSSGRELLMLNTHMDKSSSQARAEGAKLIRKRIANLADGRPVIVTGDFNETPGGEAHAILTVPSPPDGGPRLLDARETSATGHQGPDSTWNGFKAVKVGRVIDFVLASPEVEVLSHRSIDEQRDGRFASDHLPLLAVVALPDSPAAG